MSTYRVTSGRYTFLVTLNIYQLYFYNTKAHEPLNFLSKIKGRYHKETHNFLQLSQCKEESYHFVFLLFRVNMEIIENVFEQSCLPWLKFNENVEQIFYVYQLVFVPYKYLLHFSEIGR